jgi:hypothetical protein
MFTLTFKTPDVLQDLQEEVETLLELVDTEEGGPGIEDELALAEKNLAFAERYVRYDEYLTVEFDVEKGTVTVVK